MSEVYIPQGYPMRIARSRVQEPPSEASGLRLTADEPPRLVPAEYGQWVIGWRDAGRTEPVAVLADGSEVSSILIAPNAHSEYVVIVP